MRPLDFSSLERDDLPILFFRTSCDLGQAVDLHKGELVGILGNESLLSFLLRKSAEWMDRRIEELALLDYQGHVDFVRRRLDLERIDATPDSEHVYSLILAAFRTSTAEELATRLQGMSDATHAVVGQAITNFGGALSATRWSRCPPVELRFDHGAPQSTHCTFDSFHRAPGDGASDGRSSTSVITIRIGRHDDSGIDAPGGPDRTRGALRIYFNLSFYFFHEYLSHSFSVWQFDEFVEGYLLWAAGKLVDEVENDPARCGFREDTFGGPTYKTLRKVNEIADWFFRTTNGEFLRFLLDWAADENMPGEPDDLEALKYVLQYSLDNPQVLERVWLAFENPDNRAIRGELRSLPRQVSGVKPFQPRLRHSRT